MKVSPEEYLSAAMQRVDTANELYERKKYLASVYFSGVAVECLLRAYIIRYNRTQGNLEFDSRHDLSSMLKEEGVERLIKRNQRLAAYISDVWIRWKNNYRFIDDDKVKKEYKSKQLDRRVVGDYLKYNSNVCRNAATSIVGTGFQNWKNI